MHLDVALEQVIAELKVPCHFSACDPVSSPHSPPASHAVPGILSLF